MSHAYKPTENKIEMIESSDQKFRSIFMGTVFTIILLIISLSYGLTWAILFLIYTESSKREDYDEACEVLISWDKALYIVNFISSFLHIVSSIIQLVASSHDKESNIAKYITSCRSCLNYMVGFVILIGINVSYFKINHGEGKCGDLAKLNLAFIIVEWTLLGSCVCFVYVICIVSLSIKKKNNRI